MMQKKLGFFWLLLNLMFNFVRYLREVIKVNSWVDKFGVQENSQVLVQMGVFLYVLFDDVGGFR